MAERGWVSPDLQNAWGQLTAAVLVGAEAAGDRDAAVEALHKALDTFPFPMPDEEMTPDQLADLAGDLACQAHATLARLVGGRRGVPPMSSSTGGGSGR